MAFERVSQILQQNKRLAIVILVAAILIAIVYFVQKSLRREDAE